MVIIGTDNGSAIFFRNEGDAEVYRWDTNSTFAEANFKPVYRSQTGKCLHKLCQMSSPEMLVINFFCSLWVGMYRINHSAGEKPPGMRVSADILACQTRWSLVWGDSGLAAHIERALTYLGAITLMAVAEEFCGEIPRMWGPFSHSLRQPSYGWRNHCLRSFYYWQLVR